MIYVNTSCARLTIVAAKSKPLLDNKLGVEAQEYIYVEENTTRAFLLELLVSQIRLLLTHGASQTVQLRRVCNKHFLELCKHVVPLLITPNSSKHTIAVVSCISYIFSKASFFLRCLLHNGKCVGSLI